jgi:regulatory protein
MRVWPNRKSLKSRSTEPLSREKGFLYALRLLAARDYTRAGMLKKLVARGVGEADAEHTVDRLVTEGWLNDLRYAERFAEAAVSSGRFFGQRLRLEMRRRGIPVELVSEVVGRLREEHDEQDDLRSLLDRRYPDFSFDVTTDREKRRVIGFLQRRGFGFSAIMQALRARGTD